VPLPLAEKMRVVNVFRQVFPIVIYFSAVINIFYYWGLMQMVVSGIAWLMQFTMETTAIESLNAACNIFVGMVCLFGWRRGVVASVFRRMNEVTLRRARLVLGWVNGMVYYHGT